MSDKESEFAEDSFTNESRSEFLTGPPFDPKDYMISPSDSDLIASKESSPPPTPKRRIHPRDMQITGHLALDPHQALRNLKKLIDDRYSMKLVDRQGDLLSAFIKATPIGFVIEDIAILIEVIEHMARNHKLFPEYMNYLHMIFSVARAPPRLAKSSDVLYCKKELSDLFTMYGELLATFEDECVQLVILDIIHCLIGRSTPYDIDCVKSSFLYVALGESQLPLVVASLLETVPESIYVNYLEMALQMIPISTSACQAFIDNNALEYVLWRLDPLYGFRDITAQSTEVPWVEDEDLQSHYSKLEATGNVLWGLLSPLSSDTNAKCPSENALWSLRYAFRAETLKTTAKSLETRNNLAGIIVKLLSVFEDRLPIIQSGLAGDISMLAVASEMGTESSWAEWIKLGCSYEDFSLKNLMLSGCCMLTKNTSAIQILKTANVMEGILHLINTNLTELSAPWAPSQFTHLLFTALRVLSELVPRLPQDFIANDGNTRLLVLLEWCMEDDFDRQPLLETLKTLCSIVTCENNADLIRDIKDKCEMKTLLKVCSYILDAAVLKREHHERLARGFMILERLLRDEKQFHACFGESCVALSIKFLKRIVNDSHCDSKVDSRLIICFGVFLWESVVWNETHASHLIEQGGVFLILDLIEASVFPAQMLLLGVLVDLMDGGTAVTHLLNWRGKSGLGVLALLIDIWKCEERLNKVHRSENGCIVDIEKALMSEEQWYQTHCIKNAHRCSPSIIDMQGSARPKIHALYQLLRQRHRDKNQLSESSYCLYLDFIPTGHQVYVPLIEHYLTLKLGEVWYEVLRDINIGGILPTSFDGHAIETLLDHRNKWAFRIKHLQEEIIIFQKVKDTEDEQSFYELLRSCRLAPTLDALSELDFIARTSCLQFLREKKEKQRQEIEESLRHYSGGDVAGIHRTYVPNYPVTNLSGKYIWLKSETEVQLKSDVAPTVSEVCSDVEL